MKASELRLGSTYSNASKTARYEERTLIAEGPEYKPIGRGKIDDCVRYRVTAGKRIGDEGNMTRAAFAAWAKSLVSPASS